MTEAIIKISEKNIRATALKQFWGSEYAESLYLWEGAKHPHTLSEMEALADETLADVFSDPSEIVAATRHCQKVYGSFLPKIAAKLNELSALSLPNSFWRTALGYWLFRHISVTYEKFTYLSKIDIDRTSIVLLDKNSFYIPQNHNDYVYCFCTDFGVQQLVSHYYYLYKNRDFDSISMKFDFVLTKPKNLLGHVKSLIRKAQRLAMKLLRSARRKPAIVLCGVYNTSTVASDLGARSHGMIAALPLPTVRSDASVNPDSRLELLNIPCEDDFEYFMVQTLYYCLPQVFLEKFRDHYDVYLKDIRRQEFTHIVSENWISDVSSSIYVATAQTEGRKFIGHEHGSGTVFDETLTYWMDVQATDNYVTVGWEHDNDKIRPGGFMCRDAKPYQFQAWKKSVLYVARTNFPYLMEFNIYNVPNTRFTKYLKRIDDFHRLLPKSLRDCFVLRPRREQHFWDTEHALEVQNKEISVDTGVFSDSIANARIVIIDHLSTGAAEILLRGIPFLLIQDQEPAPPILGKLPEVYADLRRCGVLFDNPASAVAHLDAIYDDVSGWWNSAAVQSAVSAMISATLAPPQRTIDYLLSFRAL